LNKPVINFMNSKHPPISGKTKQILWAGDHLILEFWQCQKLNNQKFIHQALVEAVKACGAELLSINVHRFQPIGISGIAVIKESHISIHTWPEDRYAAIDVFTCGDKVKPYLALKKLKSFFKPKHIDVIELKRGVKP